VSSYVLVHGAFRGGWAWDRVAQRLRASGHDVHTPSLTGMGDRSHLADRPVTLDTWVRDLTAVVETYDLRAVHLVGHSQGGLVVRQAAAGLGDRVASVGYLDAPVADTGERGVDLNPGGAPDDDALPPADLLIPPTPLAAGGDIDDALAAWVTDRLCATPFGPSLDPVTAPPPDVPTRVAFCRDTPAGYPCWVTRGRMDDRGEPYTVIDAGHDAPLSRPGEVTDWLLADG
jgi:pimeloyl-ACP methyl ester carboxylesterase